MSTNSPLSPLLSHAIEPQDFVVQKGTAAALDLSLKFLRLRIPRLRLIVWLELATLLYLGLPALLWLGGWVRPIIALPLAAALWIALILAWWKTRVHFSKPSLLHSAELNPRKGIPLWPLLAGLVCAVVWGIYSGAGGFTHWNGDWYKHFGVFRDLIEMPWPVVYQIDGRNVPCVYYVAYYLPAALVGKLAGWWWGCLALCVWTCLGAALAAAWFATLVGCRPFLAITMFIFANGLDMLGERLVGGGPMGSFTHGTDTWIARGDAHIDWWAGFAFVNLPGHYSQLVWAPQHSLATWSVTAMLAVQLAAGRGLGHAGLLAGLLSLWSPLAVIGLAPLALVAVVRERGRGLFSFPNLMGVPILGLGAIFTLSTTAAIPQGWIWQTYSLHSDWPRYALFHLLEWVIFVLFAREMRRASDPWLRWLFWTACATLAIYPLYKLGAYNDWCMRVTIPAQLLLWAAVARSLLVRPFDLENRLLLLLCIVGAMGALHESARSWGALRQPPPMAAVDHLPGVPCAEQYLGTLESFFFRKLARPITPVAVVVKPVP